MNRSDMTMMLGQMDNLGDTLIKNRVLKQQEQERKDLLNQRDRFQTQDVGLREQALKQQGQERQDNLQAQKDWRQEQARDRRITAALHNNATGTMDDASRNEFNAWIDSDPELRRSGLTLKAPPEAKATGTMETSQTRNWKQLQELQAQIAAATTPEQKTAAESALAEFKSLLPGRNGEDGGEVYDPAQKAALAAGGAEWAKANALGEREQADRILQGINSTRANAANANGKPVANAPSFKTKHPTRAQAADYVKRFGQGARAKLKADGYDPSAYAD